MGFQVTIDVADPHAQARFWAAALGYDIEDHSNAIREILDQGFVSEDDVVDIDGRLHWRVAAAIRHPDDTDRNPLDDPAPRRLLFWQVSEAKRSKNRIHLDLNVGPDRLDDEVARLTALGATELYRVDEPHSNHVTLADPEGNEFCIQ
ncbi:MAG: hypothetical protein EA388_03490 [Nitriliruptor sp.]|nr:MAG: hypothetical protein EA388_03490 [Nitriliruptor sp.]